MEWRDNEGVRVWGRIERIEGGEGGIRRGTCAWCDNFSTVELIFFARAKNERRISKREYF